MPLALADPPDSVARVGRLPDPLEWPPPPAPMAPPPEPPGGYRWDDPAGLFETLYVATQPIGTFIETLQDLRPRVDLKATITRATSAGGGKIIRSTGIPESYFHRRTLAHADLTAPGKFIDMGDPRTHAWLTQHLPDLLQAIGEPRFERATVMTNNRRVTRAIAGYLHSQFDEIDGHPIMGLRYESKIGAFECWAVWKRGSRFGNVVPKAISRHTPELVQAADLMAVPVVPAPHPPRGR